MTLKPIDSNSNEQSQFMELRSALVSECARAYGVPSTLIGDSQMAKYSNVEQEHLSAQVWCLLPWQRRIEGAIERSILTPYIDNGDDVYLKLDSRGLLRADSSGRAALYQTLSNLGAITPNEIRDLEDLPLLDDPAADQTYMQQGFAPLAVVAQGLDQQGGGNGNGH
jgi:HK97 family phage portal protein